MPKSALTISKREAESPKMRLFVGSVGRVKREYKAKPPSREAKRKKKDQYFRFGLANILSHKDSLRNEF